MKFFRHRYLKQVHSELLEFGINLVDSVNLAFYPGARRGDGASCREFSLPRALAPGESVNGLVWS